jgi:anthranilate synthase/aminodeoxychorismate synthase-like glutamine amidotransferase
MLLIIDNYDSFTWNLVQRVGELDRAIDVRVVRNDQITPAEAEAMGPDRLIISPGPCTPREAGVSNDLIRAFRGRIPILGVCLGHQCIGDLYGMTVKRHDVLMHGKTSQIHHDDRGVYRGLSNPFIATRYHSLIVDRATIAPDFEVSAWTDAGEVMGLRWTGRGSHEAPLEGVQFHPESFLTEEGPQLLANFLGMGAVRAPAPAARTR